METAISIVIPAFNEELYIGKTLEHINNAKDYLQNKSARPVEIILVDNASTDRTAEIAEGLGAKVIHEPVRNIGQVRNVGAKLATGDTLVFIDADVLVPKNILWRIGETMDSPECAGGAVTIDHRPKRFLIKLYLGFWKILGNLFDMAQGGTQFCRRSIFMELNGYDESLYMGEDIDFYWRLTKLAKSKRLRLCCLKDVEVVPSARRFDQWPVWRTLVWTNPIYALLFRRKIEAWRGWYQTGPR
jgi:glycosyltransferase involved in cell wall biosynthesis